MVNSPKIECLVKFFYEHTSSVPFNSNFEDFDNLSNKKN